MSKVTVAFLSFIVGACVGALLLSHTPTLAQSAPQSVPLFGGKSEPPIPPISVRLNGVTIGNNQGAFVPLDGLECHDCVLADSELTYAGGSFNLPNLKLRGNIRINLKGAAANTQIMLALLQQAATGEAPGPPPNPNTPILKSASVKNTVTGSWSSPYSGQ